MVLPSLALPSITRDYTALLTEIQTQRTAIYEKIFHNLLPKAIIKLRFFWLLLFVVIFALSLVAVLYRPGFELPSRNPLQLYGGADFYEWYDTYVS